MEVPAVAERVSEELRQAFGDPVLAVGWYDADSDARTDTVYLDESYQERAKETPGRSGGVLENSLLESLGQGVYERAHEEELIADARFHETLVDLDLSLGTQAGIVVALRADGDYRLRDVVDHARDVIPTAHVPYDA